MAQIRKMEFDGVIVGGGGSGLPCCAAVGPVWFEDGGNQQVFPTRSHTVSAQGGITCAIASDDPNDDWRWHMYDTVKGSDYIGDQDAIEYMCSEGPQAVFELEHMGLPFSRTESGRIYQRPFGGQSKDFGKGGQGRADLCSRRPHRSCLAAYALSGQRQSRDHVSERMVCRGHGEKSGRRRRRCDRSVHGKRAKLYTSVPRRRLLRPAALDAFTHRPLTH